MPKKSTNRRSVPKDQNEASDAEQLQGFLSERFEANDSEPPQFSLSDPDGPLNSVEAIEEYFARVQAEFQSQINEVTKSVTSFDKIESLISSSMPLLQEKLRNALLSCPEKARQEFLEKDKQKREQERLAKEAAKKARREARKSKEK